MESRRAPTNQSKRKRTFAPGFLHLVRMRWFVTIILHVGLFALASARSERLAPSAVVLISPVAAGPSVSLATYIHPLWIEWPEPTSADGLNRVLSLVSGVNLQTQQTGWSVRESRQSKGFRLIVGKSIERTGYFAERKRFLKGRTVVPVSRIGGAISRTTLPLAFESANHEVVPARLGENPRLNSVTIFEATQWSQLDELKRVGIGRIVVLEYPPPNGRNWSRAWLIGSQWDPQMIPINHTQIPGLFQARETLGILSGESSQRWVKDNTYSWGGANRWFEWHSSIIWPFFVSLSVVFLGLLLVSVRLVSLEIRKLEVIVFWEFILLLPAILLLGGMATRFLGLGGWLIYHCVCGLLVFGLGRFLRCLFLRTDQSVHLLAGPSMAGFIAVLLSTPEWSILSPVFREIPISFATEAFGGMVGYSFLTLLWTHHCQGRAWIWPRIFFVGAILRSTLDQSFFYASADVQILLTLVGALIASGSFTWRNLIVLPFLPGPLFRWMEFGFTFSPTGAVHTINEMNSINLFEVVRVFAFPIGPLVLVSVFLAAAFSNQFFGYALQRTFRGSDLVSKGSLLLVAVLCVSPFQPLLLGCGGMIAFMGVAVLGHDAIDLI